MNKKKYQSPSFVMSVVDTSICLLAGSPNPSTGVGTKADGENINVSDKQEPYDPNNPSGDVYDGKQFNAWENWDEY